MNQRIAALVLVIVAALAFFSVITSSNREASILFINGIIYTLDKENSVAQALAIRGNRIVAVGTTD